MVTGLFIVENARGPAYDPARGRREQAGWDEHARFMDGLVEQGIVLLGGPIGEIDGERTLLVVRAENELAARAAFEPDPWFGTVLSLARVQPWTLWLGSLPAGHGAEGS